MATAELRELLAQLLGERDVRHADAIIEDIADNELHGAIAVVRRYDAEGHDSPGLLVYRLRHSDLTRYKPPELRTAAENPADGAAPTVTPKLIQTVRRGCSTPDGITREEARGMFREAAKSRGLSPDALIDMAMPSEWLETPRKDLYA